MKACVTIALITLALGVAVAIGLTQETIALIAAYCLGMFLNTINSTFVGGLQGVQQMRRPAIWEITRSYVGVGLSLLVLVNGGTLVYFALVFNAAFAIPMVANGLSLWPAIRAHVVLDFELWREIVLGSVPFFLWSALLVFYGSIDIPLLKAFSGSETVGWYTLAFKWVGMPVFFAASVAQAFFPALSAQRMQVGPEYARTANRALHLVVLVATPAAVGIALIADDFLRLLYGTEFLRSVPLMQILALHIPIVGLDVVLGMVLITADKQRQWVYVGVAAAIFNPALNMIAIPWSERLWDNGAIGAAMVTVLTEMLLMAGAISLRPAGVLDGATARLLLRIVAASGAMVPVVLAVGSQPLPVQILAGVLAYGVASRALGTVSLEDVRRSIGGPLGRRRHQNERLGNERNVGIREARHRSSENRQVDANR
jgi:O-antigen/teichoic acid export membrane protein